MDIYELVNKYVEAGYFEDDAIPKVAQDIYVIDESISLLINSKE